MSSTDLLTTVRSNSNALNLQSIQQRIDNRVTAIIHTITHAVLYELDPNTNEWDKLDVEGPLFILQRSIEPYYQLLLLNRKSPDNYCQSISINANIELQSNYLFYSDPDNNNKINGLWFYELSSGMELLSIIQKLQINLQQIPFKPYVNINTAASTNNNNNNNVSNNNPQKTPIKMSPTSKVSNQTPVLKAVANMNFNIPQKSNNSNNNKNNNNNNSNTKKKPAAGAGAATDLIVNTSKPLLTHAPPPPDLDSQLSTGIDTTDKRELQNRLSDFLSSFNQADEQYSAAHQEAVEKQRKPTVESVKQQSIQQQSQQQQQQPIVHSTLPHSYSQPQSLPNNSQQLQQQQQQQHLVQMMQQQPLSTVPIPVTVTAVQASHSSKASAIRSALKHQHKGTVTAATAPAPVPVQVPIPIPEPQSAPQSTVHPLLSQMFQQAAAAQQQAVQQPNTQPQPQLNPIVSALFQQNQHQQQQQSPQLISQSNPTADSIFPTELIPPSHIPLPPSGLPRDAYRKYLLKLLSDNSYVDYVYQKYRNATNIKQ